MSNTGMFERNGLDSVPFSLEMFHETLGDRLSEAGLHGVAAEIAELGIVRHFLAKPLSPESAKAINNVEGIAAAESAAVFQERVQRVEVRESGERLMNLRDLAAANDTPWTFTDAPYHPACGEWAGKERLFWIREQVTEGLLNITASLQKAGFGLRFEDGFRPLGVQEGLFRRRYQMALVENPAWTHEQLVLEARAKTAYTPRFAAHKGGAAVDIRVRDLWDGDLLDIGHGYPDGGALVALDVPLVTQRQWQNRVLLASIATRSSMSMYPFEDWHVCMGDTTASACVLGDDLPPAVYGPVKRFDPNTGEVLEVYTSAELDQVFEVI
jgi:D-alanyl-D-alanine dipeptidase